MSTRGATPGARSMAPFGPPFFDVDWVVVSYARAQRSSGKRKASDLDRHSRCLSARFSREGTGELVFSNEFASRPVPVKPDTFFLETVPAEVDGFSHAIPFVGRPRKSKRSIAVSETKRGANRGRMSDESSFLRGLVRPRCGVMGVSAHRLRTRWCPRRGCEACPAIETASVLVR